MTKYSRGADFERETRDVLERIGFWVMRSAGSKGKVDIFALREDALLFVQCKTNGLCPPGERKEILRIASMNPLGVPLVAYKHKEGRAAAVTRFYRLTGPESWQRKDWTPSPFVDLSRARAT